VLLNTLVNMLKSSTGVCISTSLKLPHLPYYLGYVLYLSSLVDRLVDRIGI
jgi:hypothetical protein